MLFKGLRSKKFLSALAFLLPSCLPLGASQAALIIRVGEATSVHVGDTFTVPILVAGVTDLMAFQFDLSYDAAILSAIGFTDVGLDFDAAASAGGGALTGLTGFIFPGVLSGVADSISGASSGLTGGGVLVEIEFQALARGMSQLTLSSVLLDFSEPDPDSIVNGVVSVPEPSTVALLIAAPVLIGWRRRARGSNLQRSYS